MVDFIKIATRSPKRGVIEIYPKFIIKRSSDLMVRGGDFYAVWCEKKGLWSTDEQDLINIIDTELRDYYETNKIKFDGDYVRVLYLWDAESGMIDAWHKYCQRQSRDNFKMLDETLIFSDTEVDKHHYASKRLDYPLQPCDISAYDKLIGVLYSPEERLKIEWAIGAIITGDSKHIQKFMVLYGSAGTGKSTILNIIQWLFKGYYSVFDAKALGSSNNSFALESFKDNPLIAIQHDGDLSRIEDNTRINSLVSHEVMTVNEKFKSSYANRFKCFLLMGTNKPVKITDAKSGLIRRLIDVSPSGDKVPVHEYKTLMEQIQFELGGIASHCKDIYLNNVNLYDDYIPINMLGASNDFYNFMVDSYNILSEDDIITLKAAWEMYKNYCEDSNITYPLSQRAFKEELKNYFKEYHERYVLEDGTRVRKLYCGFRLEKFGETATTTNIPDSGFIKLQKENSIFDIIASDYPAQYASSSGGPSHKWIDNTTTLSDIDTSRLHYVKLPENHIVIDFDIQNGHGLKLLDENIKEALKFPPTYTEVSKSGLGLHLHYIYEGDPSRLEALYSDHIEIKTFKGNAALRRKLTLNNGLPITTINSGLPLKGDDKLIDFDTLKNEKHLRSLIIKNLNKEIHPGTKPSIDFISHLLEQALESKMIFDVSDMRPAILTFAMHSTNQAETCIKIVNKMVFKSESLNDSKNFTDDSDIIFYDVEVFPNLFLVNWKKMGDGKTIVRMINPTSTQLEPLLNQRLIGYNNRRYDNHIMYARILGYTEHQLYSLSKRIISGDRDALFGEAFNLSYADIYDFAKDKKSLKKWQIELGLEHKELGYDWDRPVPEDKWIYVSEYCDNDVISTEAVFNHLQSDYKARLMLADIADMTPNDTSNMLTTRIIFGKHKPNPEKEFNYRDMGDVSKVDETLTVNEYTKFTADGLPIFPGYKFAFGKSTYRGFEVGEGGFVFAMPHIWTDVALFDITSMHPTSIIREQLFGKYTKKYADLVNIRVDIKQGLFENVKTYFDGKLSKYVDDGIEMLTTLDKVLKIPINSVYGLTSAKFDNAFRDPRNIDNIVAKRGALFMINLLYEVQERGFIVAHIKTDSIKIPNMTPELAKFIHEYADLYGYKFEHEATYDRMCLVNDAVYIAKYADGKQAGKWTATGTQFQVPYVFKTLFSKEPVEFKDLCETKSVTTAMYLDENENLPDVKQFEAEFEKRMFNKKYEGVKKKKLDIFMADYTDDMLEYEIKDGHSYRFIGRVGSFCPVKSGLGGGVLCREKDGKYYAVTGTKGYRWLEDTIVQQRGLEKQIDMSHFDKYLDGAKAAIEQYLSSGTYEVFCDDETFELCGKILPF